MGAEYAAYLRSDQWAEIRKAVLIRDNWTCQRCGRSADREGDSLRLHVHHRNYSVIFREWEDLSTLEVLCRSCHDYMHMTIGQFMEVMKMKLEIDCREGNWEEHLAYVKANLAKLHFLGWRLQSASRKRKLITLVPSLQRRPVEMPVTPA